jgi:hypothetical protein
MYLQKKIVKKNSKCIQKTSKIFTALGDQCRLQYVLYIWSRVLRKFYVHVTVHRDKFPYNKTN